jgi:hypothetical protein
MNQRNRYGITRKVRTVSITLFALYMMSVVVLSQQQYPRVVPASIPPGMAAIKLADGRDVQTAPVPDLPYNGDQQCGPWQRVNTLGYYNACNVVAQAGVPFRGWIVSQNLCGGDHIDAIVPIDHDPFQTTGPAPNPQYPIPSTTADFDIYYFPNGSWPEKMHLNGDHLWQNPGTYSISGRAQTVCLRPYNRQWIYFFPISATATVSEPTAPQSITTPQGGKAIAGGTYPNFGRVTQFSDTPVPASGTLVLLTVDKLGILDLVTPFGRTGLQQTGGVNYVSTYVYVPAGQQSADFDVVVAASAKPGDEVTVRAECVGIPGNWKIPSHCDEVNKQPQVLTIRITQ